MELQTENYWLGGPDDATKKPLVIVAPEIAVYVRPIDDDMRDEGERAYFAELEDMPRGDDGKPADGCEPFFRNAWKAYSRTLMRLGIADWRGIEQGGQPVAVSPERIESFIKNPDVFDGLCARYAGPFLTRLLEKNVSSLSPTGTSGAQTRSDATAADATTISQGTVAPVPIATDPEPLPGAAYGMSSNPAEAS